jgi:ribose transport system substrate-binding protein
MPIPHPRSIRALFALVLAAAALVAGCGGGDDNSSSGSTDASTTAEQKPLKVAFMAGIVANPYTQASTQAMKDLGARENVSITVIDSQFNPDKQFAQFQDLVAAKQYDGIILLPLNGTALKPLVKQASDAGIKIGATDLPLGPDNTTTDVQAEGVSVTVLRPFSKHGGNLGTLTVDACEGIDPCKVAFMYGVKASPFDQQMFTSFKEAVADSPNIQIVAEIEGQYSRDGGQKATQDVLQAHNDLNVLVGVDQSILGAEPALKAAGLTGKVKLIGYGGTRQGIAAIEAGRWFGNSVSAPYTEGKLALQGVIDAIRNGRDTGGLDAVTEVGAPDDGRITRDNVAQFTAEYDG